MNANPQGRREGQRRWRIEGLGARGPDLELKEKLMLFGQFVGDWDIVEARYPHPDGTEELGQGEVHFDWILGGRAIQDVWMKREEDLTVVPVGTTIRYYDSKTDYWSSTWISPTQSIVQTFTAGLVGEEIVLNGKTKDGFPERWIFLDIKPNSFRWRSEMTSDGGATWVLTEEMRIRRRGWPETRA
jgi:hypothetical protein